MWLANEEEGGDKNFQPRPAVASFQQAATLGVRDPHHRNQLNIQGEADTVVSSKGKKQKNQ